ncbi:hypothetical protein NQ318_015809 [Aromia moschata]|uniref:Uncharacterized protein n=1 Tax=Aromia moschata TaxID=1265417 RepID=A0AAV8YPK6_9CUCU|nr:hypothetical protein NQ318_015809 [Aromia moschata]
MSQVQRSSAAPPKTLITSQGFPMNRNETPRILKREGRDYDLTRPSPISRPSSGPSGSAGKYEGRPYDSRDTRAEPRGRELLPSRPKDSRYMDRGERPRQKSTLQTVCPGRFDRGNSSWSGAPQKPFNSSGPPKPWAKDPWRPDSSVSDRAVKPSGPPRLPSVMKWPSGPQGGSSGRPFSGNSNSNMAPVCPPPPPGINSYPERFDYGKSLNTNLRKY